MLLLIVMATILLWELTQLRTKTLALLNRIRAKVLGLYLTAVDKLEEWSNKL